MSTGGPGSTAGQPGKGRRAEDTGPGGQREKGKKVQKEMGGKQDGIDMATMKRAKGTAEGT